MGERPGVIVVASDRNDVAKAMLQVYRLDTREREAGAARHRARAARARPMASCLMAGARRACTPSRCSRTGTVIEQVAIDPAGKAPVSADRAHPAPDPDARPKAAWSIRRHGTLYVGRGRRRYLALRRAADEPTGELVAKVDDKHLFADVEGLALLPTGASGGWLVASSQGDNAYALFSLPGMKPAGRFTYRRRARFGATEETDGIALARRQLRAGLSRRAVRRAGRRQRSRRRRTSSWSRGAAVRAAPGDRVGGDPFFRNPLDSRTCSTDVRKMSVQPDQRVEGD